MLSSQDVDAGLAEQAEEAAVGVGGDQVFDLGERQPADGGDPVRLDPGVGLGDMGVDAGGRFGDRVDRDAASLGQAESVVGLLELQVGGEVFAHRFARFDAVGAERCRRR